MSNEDKITDEQVDEREAARVHSEPKTDEPVQHDQEEAEARGLGVGDDD